MDDRPDVRTIDSHAERVRGDDHIEGSICEAPVHVFSHLSPKPGMIRCGTPTRLCDGLRDLFRIATCRRIDDGAAAGLVGIAERLSQRLLAFVCAALELSLSTTARWRFGLRSRAK